MAPSTLQPPWNQHSRHHANRPSPSASCSQHLDPWSGTSVLAHLKKATLLCHLFGDYVCNSFSGNHSQVPHIKSAFSRIPEDPQVTLLLYALPNNWLASLFPGRYFWKAIIHTTVVDFSDPRPTFNKYLLDE